MTMNLHQTKDGTEKSGQANEIGGNIVFEVPTVSFPIRIYSHTDKYPGHLPPLMPSAKKPRDHISFVSKKVSDFQRNEDRNLIEMKEKLTAFGARYNEVHPVLEPFFSDFDKQEVLPATVALSFMNAYGTDLDNLGSIGLDTDVTYPQDVVDAIVEDYASLSVDTPTSGLSLPRNRFIGYPFMIGGGQRELNDVFLAFSAAIVQGVHVKSKSNDSLANIYSTLHQFHGDPFALQGTRLQTTAKEMVTIVNEGVFSTTNGSPRPRIIQMMDKLSVMDIRPEIKLMLEYIKNHPVHTQDRAVIAETINKWVSSNMFVVAADYSKFDFRHGGARGRQQLEIHSRVINSARYLKSATTAFDVRSFTYGHHGLWELPGDATLKSGMGTTTLVGCTANYTAVVAVLARVWKMEPRLVIAARGSRWDVLMWGDDSVLALPDAATWEQVKEEFKFYKLEVDEEPTIKYLGSNYDGGSFSGSWDKGYSVGRFFQQQFFPERTKLYPFNLLGYIARLDLVGPKSKDMHNALLKSGLDLGFEQRFKFEDRHDVLRALLPEIQKHSDKIGLIDDILQVFTHGMPELEDSSGMFDSVYMDLLGMSQSADLTDPTHYLKGIKEESERKSLRSSITPEMLRGMDKVSNGDFVDYPRLISELVVAFKLNSNVGSVIY